ncbi:hypothetical protein [uncultured Campylobacter sp.]|uniref:hypothetical protein n=2 Tax=uncultured Campylobacter sp. TaxID=218934 RepID=UPI002623B04F|nr:hypothetical protein [uncultured Campylobacter sp.]
MKQVFLVFVLWLCFSGAAFAMQDTEPSEAQGQNSAGIKILSDGFYKMSAEERGKALNDCDASHSYGGCDKIFSQEISQLIKKCNMGDGKYSTCQNLLSITDKHCFEKEGIENSLACGLYGEILLKTNRSSIALKPLTRACEVGKIWNSCLLSALTYFEYALDVDEVIKYMTMARDLAYDKERYNKIIKKLQDCKADKECNPAKLEFQ